MDDAHEADPQKCADERLVHGLLTHVYDPQAEQHREQRVQRAIHAIRAPETAEPTSDDTQRQALVFPRWGRRGLWSTAASILAVIGLLFLASSPSPAMVTLNDILKSLGLPGVRAYHIQVDDQPAPAAHRPAEENWPQSMPKPRLDQSTLYLRDASEYLLVRHDPQGGMTYDGYDGHQSWRVKDGTLAATQAGPGAGGIPMPPIMADVPFTDLKQTLGQILVNYTVEEHDLAKQLADGKTLRYVKVRRNSRQVKGPDTIEIWADPESGIPSRIIFDEAKLHGIPHPCRITFELFSEKPLPEDWFTPKPHLSVGQ
ncbi:MAG: hypothetical protein PF961_04745 [Planctomycetota bacterium]|jgi:hypothetical protein|nr:hypothetical protein [Planctomycetota bacterium]